MGLIEWLMGLFRRPKKRTRTITVVKEKEFVEEVRTPEYLSQLLGRSKRERDFLMMLFSELERKGYIYTEDFTSVHPKSSVYRWIKRLEDLHIVEKSKDGRIVVPSPTFPKILEKIRREVKEWQKRE